MPAKGKAASKGKAVESTATGIGTAAAAAAASASASATATTIVIAKGKARAKETETETATAPSKNSVPTLCLAPPHTANERTQQRYAITRALDIALSTAGGLSALPPAQQSLWLHARLVSSPSARAARHLTGSANAKAQRDLWRLASEADLPLRTLRDETRALPFSGGGSSSTTWGRDRAGRDLGDLPLEKFEERVRKRTQLTALWVGSRVFRSAKERAQRNVLDPQTREAFVVTETEVEEEKKRRERMAQLKRELYGDQVGSYARDPDWDDVVPVPQDEPEAALACIAYPDDYGEAISYLRAVMMAQEYSPRTLRLTEHIISMNPAHYTVWLYRASIVFALHLSIPDEIAWLNQVSLEHLKNYQIWHHRHLLVSEYLPSIDQQPERLSKFAAEEREFLTTILAEDTKNYHVWSYRSWLVGRLGLWDDPAEIASIDVLIDEDVRNNSAWSHRFHLVFSNPKYSTAGVAATEHDPRCPAEIVDHEVQYAQTRARLAPQNQSAWNYLLGVLAKGGRKKGTIEEFVREFVRGVGERDEDQEVVQSTHALDVLADVYAERGEKERADVCLRRLADRYDPIRAGYWQWKRNGFA